jgi:LemA protein
MAGGKKGCLIIFVIIGVLVLLLYPSIKGIHRQLVTLKEGVTVAWSQMGDTFRRRLDLIPNYVETVKSYAPHEEEVFGVVTQLQLKLATRMTLPAKIAANNDLTAALDQLRLVAERYPDLKADQTFISLTAELADTENRIAEGRMRYNEAVREYNASIQRFPTVIVSALSGFTKIPLLEDPEEAQVHRSSRSESPLPYSSE